MVFVLTVTETNYLLVSLFCDLVGPFPIYICGIKFFGFAICLVSSIVTKVAITS